MPGTKFFVVSLFLISFMFGFYLISDYNSDNVSKAIITSIKQSSSTGIASDSLLHLAGGALLGICLTIFRLRGFYIGWGIIIGWEIMQGLTELGTPELSDILAGGSTFSLVMFFICCILLNPEKRYSVPQ